MTTGILSLCDYDRHHWHPTDGAMADAQIVASFEGPGRLARSRSTIGYVVKIDDETFVFYYDDPPRVKIVDGFSTVAYVHGALFTITALAQ